MKKVLITGSAGFIFSNFIRQPFIKNPNYNFISVDKVVSPYNLQHIFEDKEHKFYMCDIADEHFMENIFRVERPDIVIHGAAESFVDDAIKSAQPFIRSNVLGTQVMIDLSLKYGVERFIYVSTDEVYGQLLEGEAPWTEESPVKPRNPYSASKLCGETLVFAAHETHGLKYNITRCSNNFGPRQPPRNLVPRCLTSMLNDCAVPIHGEGKQHREWIYVADHCNAIMKIVEGAPLNEVYNVGSGFDLSNMEMVNEIAKILNIKPKLNFIKDRAGHDWKYSVDCSKLKQLGWNTTLDFHTRLQETVRWYQEHPDYYIEYKDR